MECNLEVISCNLDASSSPARNVYRAANSMYWQLLDGLHHAHSPTRIQGGFSVHFPETGVVLNSDPPTPYLDNESDDACPACIDLILCQLGARDCQAGRQTLSANATTPTHVSTAATVYHVPRTVPVAGY